MTRASQHSRRAVLAGGAAGLLTPTILRAQSSPFAAALDQAASFDQLHAIMIAQDGAVTASRVVRGPSLSTPVNVKSVSKTVVAALTGAAIARGELPGLDATLGRLTPGLIPSGADPQVRDITIENLVTMRSGLDRTSGGNYGQWVQSSNWVRYALARDMVAAPGAGMQYSTGDFHILGAVLSEVTGRSLLALARGWLGDPLSIQIPPWTRDPQGRYMGGNNMALSPRAMIRFGEMYRNDGMSDGTRVLNADWVADSFNARGTSPWSGMGYGLGWFLDRADGVDYALARGYGGQVITVVPDRGLTIAITSDPNRPARSQGYFGDLRNLIETRIIPAAGAS